MKTEAKKKRTDIVLNEEDTKKLDSLASKEDVSRSFLIRRAIRKYLAEKDQNEN